jgi:hypothetical protein
LPLLLGISGGLSIPSGLRCRLGFSLGDVAELSAGSIFSGFGCFLAFACFFVFFVFIVSIKIPLTGKLISNVLEIIVKRVFFILADDKYGVNINNTTIYASHFIIEKKKKY